MRSIKFSEYLKIVKPEYAYLKLTPNNSVRNNSTYRLAKGINSLYKNVLQNIKKEKAKLINILGKDFLLGTQYSFSVNSKVSYFIYIENKKIDFYFILPKYYLSIIKEKISDSWSNITVAEVDAIPTFSDKCSKYHLTYSKEDALSLAVDRRNNELLESNLNVVDVLEEGDKVGIFYNFIPTSQLSWNSEYRTTIDKIKKNLPIERSKVNLTYLLKMTVSIINDLLTDVSNIFSGVGINVIAEQNNQMFLQTLQQFNNQKTISDATHRKKTDTIMQTQILVLSESKDKLRERNNAKSLTQSFDTISEDNNLVAKAFNSNFNPLAYKIPKAEVNKISSKECSNFISLPGRELLERYNFMDKVETQETAVPEELTSGVMCLGESTFKGNKQLAYLSNDFDYRMLGLVLIGPNRAGKSKFLANIARDAINNNECVIIPDYIGSCQLSTEISSVFPKEKVLEIQCDNWETLQGLGYNEVPASNDPFVQYKNAKEQTALLLTLVDSISDDNNLTSRMSRYFESAALVVFLSNGPFRDVFNVLLNHKKRKEYIDKLPEAQKENMEEYIDYLLELDSIDKGQVIGTKTHLITGAIDRLQKLKVNAHLEMMLKKDTTNNINLVEEIQKNQLIVLKMPQRMFLTDNEKDVYVTYWLTKIWLALQIREEQVKDRDKMTKLNLIIDELYQVNNTEKFLTKKLSQLPKFNIKPIISCHYLNQIKIIREELRSANASYMLISGCDKKNYEELKSELYPFVEEDMLNLKRFHSMNLIKCNNGYGKFITLLPKPITS